MVYANIGGILMVNVTIYIAYMDPMGNHCFFLDDVGVPQFQKPRSGGCHVWRPPDLVPTAASHRAINRLAHEAGQTCGGGCW